MELGNRSSGKFKLAAAAECPAFGIRRYRATMGRSFWRCSPCSRVFMSTAAAQKHRCSTEEPAQAAPRPARQRSAAAAELLPGGIQLNVHLGRPAC